MAYRPGPLVRSSRMQLVYITGAPLRTPHIPDRYLTTTRPNMLRGWTEQLYRYVPGPLKVTL